MSFTKKSKSVSGEAEALPDDFEYPYELFVIDTDTAVFRASKFIQEDYIVVKHNTSGKELEFKNKTAFYGHFKKKDGGWLAGFNTKKAAAGKAGYKVEDFVLTEHERLSDEIDDHLAEAIISFDRFVGSIKRANLAPDYKLCIGGEGNFRYEFAESAPYKGERPSKPLMFQEVRDAIIEKYKSKVHVVHSKECDDELSVYGKENLEEYRKTKKWKYVLGYIDKDLKMIVSPSVNLDKLKEGVVLRTPLECLKHYGKQLLIGDKSVDNIMGLPNLTEELRVKYGVRKGKGLGDTTAINFLKECSNGREVMERVVEAYKAYYGDMEFEFTSYRGDVYNCNWLDRLNEVAMLVYMSPLDNPLDYHITQTLDKYGVDC
tara:strand:- start:1931 stop:3052 length:1122 start_codon:yes stop_codon:yes gene_type:complete